MPEAKKQTLQLNFDRHEVPVSRSVAVAVGVLLMGVAKSDHNIAVGEREEVVRAISEYFLLERTTAAKITQISESLLEDRGKLEECVAILREVYTQQQLEKLLLLSWRVSNSDCDIAPAENEFIRGISDKVGIDYPRLRKLRQQAIESGT